MVSSFRRACRSSATSASWVVRRERAVLRSRKSFATNVFAVFLPGQNQLSLVSRLWLATTRVSRVKVQRFSATGHAHSRPLERAHSPPLDRGRDFFVLGHVVCGTRQGAVFDSCPPQVFHCCSRLRFMMLFAVRNEWEMGRHESPEMSPEMSTAASS